MNNHSLRLVTSWATGLETAVVGLCCFGVGFYLALTGQSLGWLVCAFSAPAIVIFVLEKLSKCSELTLTSGGFSFNDGSNTSSFRWRDVESFTISRSLFAKHVMFNLSESGREGRPLSGSFGQDALATDANGLRRLPDDYGMGAEKLRRLMIQWQSQFS